MTARAHARRGVLSRLIHRDRAHAPALTSEYPQQQAAASTPRRQRPPWDTAELPAYQAAYWTPLPAGTSFPAIVGDPVYGQDAQGLDIPKGLVRPYAPQSQPAPEPAYEPQFLADFRDLPVFRRVARTHGYAPAGLVRHGGQVPSLPDFRIGELMHASFTGMDAMHPGREAAA